MTVSRSILDIWVVQSQGILTPTFECESVCKCLCAKLQLLEFRLIQLFKDLKHTPLTHSCERYLSQTINKTSTTARCHVFVKFPVNFAPSDFPEYSRNWIDKQGSEIHTLMFIHIQSQHRRTAGKLSGSIAICITRKARWYFHIQMTYFSADKIMFGACAALCVSSREK